MTLVIFGLALRANPVKFKNVVSQFKSELFGHFFLQGFDRAVFELDDLPAVRTS